MKEIVLNAIQEINKELNNDRLRNMSNETLLFENLDSISILDLILEIEDKLQTKYGQYMPIADDNALNEMSTPFKTIDTLVIFLENKINAL